MLRRSLFRFAMGGGASAGAGAASGGGGDNNNSSKKAASLDEQYASTGSNMVGGGAERKRTSLQVSLGADKAGALCDLLGCFKRRGVNVSQVANRPRPYESTAPLRTIFLDCDAHVEDESMKGIVSELEAFSHNVLVSGSWRTPWYPTRPEELDYLDQSTLAAGEELQDDPQNPHPGFHDEAYRARRREIVRQSKTYRTGKPIPVIDYTEEEHNVWRTVYDHLFPLHRRYACEQYNFVFPLMLESGALSRERIPQIRDVSAFLHEATGFTVRPVAGLLSSRDFLNALAFRVFFSTQYIRHAAQPLYTPEPDLVHDIFGHLPLLADPDFANFTQTVGLASLGASDELLDQLAKVYWYSVEFGLCHQTGGARRVYGAGILSSAAEIQYSMGVGPDAESGTRPEYVCWDPATAAVTPFPITNYQPKYFVAKSFADAQRQLEEWLSVQDKPFYVTYNAFAKQVNSYPKNTWQMLQQEVRHNRFTF